MSEMKECCGIEDYLLCRCAEIDAIHANNARLESDNYDLRGKLSSLNEALIAAEAKVAQMQGVVEAARETCDCRTAYESECHEGDCRIKAALSRLTPEPEGKPCEYCGEIGGHNRNAKHPPSPGKGE